MLCCFKTLDDTMTDFGMRLVYSRTLRVEMLSASHVITYQLIVFKPKGTSKAPGGNPTKG